MLERHYYTHSGVKHMSCSYCDYKTYRTSLLSKHMLVHSDERKCICQECGKAYKSSDSLRDHIFFHHTTEGNRKMKRKQKNIADYLMSVHIQFSEEFFVSFNCFETDGKRAYVDFVIPKTWGHILLEVDECQHRWYNQSCETRRMMDIYSSLCASTEKVCFFRYNPDSFCRDGRRVWLKRRERKKILEQYLINYIPKLDFEILYFFYDEVRGTPQVTLDVEHNLKDFCKTVNEIQV